MSKSLSADSPSTPTFGCRLKRRLGASSALLVLAFGISTLANAEDYKEPPRRFVDPLGVDIAESNFVRHDTFLTVGNPSAGGLSWTYHSLDPSTAGDFSGYLGDSCSAPPPIFSQPTCDYSGAVYVWIGKSATAFGGGLGGGTYTNYSGNSATLTYSGGYYTYTDTGGTIYTLTATALLSIKYPNGMLVTINSGGSAVSNTGFAIRFSAGAVDAVNMLAHSCDAQALTCNAYDSHISVAQVSTDSCVPVCMAGTGLITQITDPAGQNWSYRVSKKFTYRDPLTSERIVGPRTLWAFRDPTGYYVNTSRGVRGGLSAFIDPRGTFTYSGQSQYQDPNDPYTNTTKDPSNTLIYTADMNEGNGTIAWNKDALNRQTSYGISEFVNDYSTSGHEEGVYTRINSVTFPEGNYVSYSYDARGNVTQTVATPKAGSGLAAIIPYRAGYDTTCSNLKTCNQPNWTKDAAGNQTDYTYDGTHGGVLTITLPADQNGLRQRTYKTYTAFDTGNGYIYRLTRTETCGLNSGQLGLTACPALTTTSVTTIGYGNASTSPYMYKSFAPYQVTQTDGAGSLSATTTFTYDVIGNVVAVNGPRTDVDDTSYKTYDANRRVIFEIGVDPDGGGSVKRTMVKHTYDAAGRETRTETGSGNATNGSDFVVASFTRLTYDTAGRLIKTEVVQP